MFAQQFVLVNPAQHDVKAFGCGSSPMNEFLARFAAKHMRLGISRTWVLTVADNAGGAQKTPVAAYYTLAAEVVEREHIHLKSSHPHRVPVVLLARLAVDKQFQGGGLGEKTLITALRKAVELTANGLPAIGIILDVLDETALKFYQRFEDFEPFTDDPMRLFMPMNVARLL